MQFLRSSGSPSARWTCNCWCKLAHLTQWSRILIVIGVLSILAATWANRPAVWRPVVVNASAVASDTTNVQLRAGVEYEVSLEAARQTVNAATKQLIARKPQTAIAGQWAIACQGEQIATGDLTHYIRIETVASWRGEWYRLIARVPFGVDEAKYWGFGVAGSYLSERIVGAFQPPDEITGPCEFSWAIERSTDNVRLAVRRNEQDWRAHNRQLRVLPIGGAMALLLGLSGLLVRGLMVLRSRRDDSPARPR